VPDRTPSHVSASLPERPALDHLKKQAKELRARARTGDADALSQFVAAVRRISPETDPRTLTLAEAQHTLAVHYGFDSWPKLKAEVLRRRARQVQREGLPDDPEARLALVCQAIEQHDLGGLKALVQLDPSLAEAWGDNRPLAAAAEADFPEAIDVLIDAGASLEPNHRWPHTPLSWALTTSSLRAARRLAERGAPVDLWCVAGLGDVERIQSFFDGGKPIPEASRHGATRYDDEGRQLPKPPTDPTELISDALYIACRNGHLEVARELLSRGADPSFEGFARAPALHWAAFSANAELVRLLLEHGADPSQRDGVHGFLYRQFAVGLPIEWSWQRPLRRVLAGDPSLANEADASFGPPLHRACVKGLPEHARILLEHGANPAAIDAEGRTAEQCAELAEDHDARETLLALLVSAGSDADKRSST
jgi:ankyrin repeat protein